MILIGLTKIVLKKSLAIIDSNKFGYRNKISEFKYIDIKDVVNNIKNNTISEISANEGLNSLNEIKKAEIIKYKKCTPGQKELLDSFNDLSDAILTDKLLKSKGQKDDENENDKTLMPSNEDDENENENQDGDDETMSQNKKIYKNKATK